VLIRRTALEGTGRLNPDLVTGDYEFLTRLAYRFPCAILHRPLVRIRKHPGNTSRRLAAEGLVEAIHSIERCKAAGEISHQVYREMTLTFRAQLGALLAARGEHRAARREYLRCVRSRPTSPRGWLGLASTFALPVRGR
jgi:hypothetical protein